MTDYHKQIRDRMGQETREIGPGSLAERLRRAGFEGVSAATSLNSPTVSFDVPATAFTPLEPASTGSAIVFDGDGGFEQLIIRLPRVPTEDADRLNLADALETMVEGTALPEPWLVRVTRRVERLDPHIKHWTDLERGPSVLHGSVDDPNIRYHPQNPPSEPVETMTPTEVGDVIEALARGFYDAIGEPYFTDAF